MRRLSWAVALTLLFAFAVWLRVTQTYGTSWAGAQLIPLDTDPYYQLRRVELVRAGDFPPGVGDGFVNAPSRFDCPWPIGLPLLLDGIVGVATLGRGATRHQLEAIVAFAIPVLGALTPLLIVLLLRRWGRAVAWLGGLAAAAIPSSRMAGHYARIDHHVLEPAAALGLYLLVMATPSPRRWRVAIAGALFGAAAALTLDLTFVFMAALAGIGVVFALARRPLAVDRTAVVAIAAGAAAATLLDVAIGAPRSLAVDLRLVVCVAFAAGLLARREAGRASWAVLGAALLYGAIRGAALGMWLAAPTDPVTRTMDEAAPGWSHATAAQALFHLLPLLVATAALGVGAGDKRRRDLPLFAYLVALALLNAAQAKYQALRAIAEACGWAFMPALLAQAIPARWTLLRRSLAPLVGVVVVAGGVALLPPNERFLEGEIARGLAELAARVPQIADPGYLRPRAQPASLTLAHPVDGPRFGYLARVAVPALPFWGQPTSLRQYEETLALLREPYSAALERRFDDWRVKYVVVTKPRAQLGLYEQLRIALGSAQPGWPATSTLRLVADVGVARLFERVPGARVRGHARAGEAVEVDALVRATPQPLGFRATATAGSDGSFTVVFPYASRTAWPATVAAVQLRCGATTRALDISDDAVEHGVVVAADCP